MEKHSSLDNEKNHIIVHSSWKLFNKELLSELNSIDNISDLQLLLTVISSYYINWEELPAWRTSELTVKFVNNLLKNWKLNLKFNWTKWYWSHLSYIRKHLWLYYETRNNWRLYNKWEKNLKQITLNIWKKLHKFNNFRDSIVSHWPWSKLSDKEKFRAYKEGDNKTLHSSSNFLFPPSDYIPSLLDKLDKKLKDKNIWIYEKAAYIGSYIFLTHPFLDGNSRTSRILMISYLDQNDKKFIKLYTFLSTFLKDLPSYDDFLEKEIYTLFDTIRDKVNIEEFRTDTWKFDIKINSYPSIDDYDKLIDIASKKLLKRIIKTSKYIYDNMEKINSLLKLISLPSSLKAEEKIVANYFLENIFNLLKNKWLKWLFLNKDQIFLLPDKFFKENKIDNNIINKVKWLIEDILIEEL